MRWPSGGSPTAWAQHAIPCTLCCIGRHRDALLWVPATWTPRTWCQSAYRLCSVRGLETARHDRSCAHAAPSGAGQRDSWRRPMASSTTRTPSYPLDWGLACASVRARAGRAATPAAHGGCRSAAPAAPSPGWLSPCWVALDWPCRLEVCASRDAGGTHQARRQSGGSLILPA